MIPRSIRRPSAVVAGLAALAAVPAVVLALAASGSADAAVATGTAGAAGTGVQGVQGVQGVRFGRSLLSDEQRQCLQDRGVSLPDRSAWRDGERPSEEQREAFRDAAEACGIQFPKLGGRRLGSLSDEQRQCLQDQGATLPNRGERPSEEQRQALHDAAEACGIRFPACARVPRASGMI